MGDISAPARFVLNMSVYLGPKVSVQSYYKVKRVHLSNVHKVTHININTYHLITQISPNFGGIKEGPICGARAGSTSEPFENMSKGKKSKKPHTGRYRSYICCTMKERQHTIVFTIVGYLLCGL